MNQEAKLLAFFGHHKGATTWIRNIVYNVCFELGIKPATVGFSNKFEHDLKTFIERERIDFLSYVLADFKYVSTLDNFKGFHVVRDPRDVIVSGYFSHLYSHSTDKWKKLIPHREKLEKVSKEHGLFLEMEFSKQTLEDVYNWNYSLPNILELKMENIIQNPYESFVEVFQFLGILDKSKMSVRERLLYSASNLMARKVRRYTPFQVSTNKMPTDRVLEIVYKNRFYEKAKGRGRGKEDVKSHYRKGIAGDWKNHFNEEHVKFFKDNYNDLLIKLEYESDFNW